MSDKLAEGQTAGDEAARYGSNAILFGDAIAARIEALAAITDEPGKLTRLYLGPAHRRAADQVAVWMAEAGMAARHDAVGTVVGRYEAAEAGARTLLLGSHIDTVRDAGRYDGTVGVLAALAVVEQLLGAGRRLPFAIEVLAFGDEEGVRYPGTLTGSRALAGRFDPKLLDEMDRDGIPRRQAMADFGCEVSAIGSEARDPATILGYVEVHIEQGPVLEAEDRAVAVVTAIAGATRGRITVTGESGHAGTVPMTLRRDALAAAAEMILAIESFASANQDLVATVGVLEVTNGAVNAVPGAVTFTLDVRSPSDAVRHAAVAGIGDAIAAVAARRSVSAGVDVTYEAPAASSDGALTDALSAAMRHCGLPVRALASGAGHDAMSFKDCMPFAMLFVRCLGGISHNPAEYAAPADIDAATRVLAAFVDALAHPGAPA